MKKKKIIFMFLLVIAISSMCGCSKNKKDSTTVVDVNDPKYISNIKENSVGWNVREAKWGVFKYEVPYKSVEIQDETNANIVSYYPEGTETVEGDTSFVSVKVTETTEKAIVKESAQQDFTASLVSQVTKNNPGATNFKSSCVDTDYGFCVVFTYEITDDDGNTVYYGKYYPIVDYYNIEIDAVEYSSNAYPLSTEAGEHLALSMNIPERQISNDEDEGEVSVSDKVEITTEE